MRYARLAAPAAALALVVASAATAGAEPIDIAADDPAFVVGNTVWDLYASAPPTIQNVWIYEEGIDPTADDAGDHLVNFGYHDLWWSTFVGGTTEQWGMLDGSMVFDMTETAEGDIVLLGATERLDGLDVTVEYRFYADGDLVRSLATYTNPGDEPVTVSTGTWSGFGDGDEATIAATSSGDTAVTPADRWLISHNGGQGEPVLTMVWQGPGADVSPDDTTAGTAGEGFAFSLTTLQEITLAPGETLRLAYFTQVTAYEVASEPEPTPSPTASPGLGETPVLSDIDAAVTTATTATSEFGAFSGRLTAGLAAGTEVANWGTVSAPVAPPATPGQGDPAYTG